MNADTVVVANSLWRNSALRESLVTAAQEYVKNNPKAEYKTQLDETKKRLEELALPIGWSGPDPYSDKGWPKRIGWHLPGWLITALAISLGAPFWFDLLNKIMVVRSTVKPQEKSPEETSKA